MAKLTQTLLYWGVACCLLAAMSTLGAEEGGPHPLQLIAPRCEYRPWSPLRRIADLPPGDRLYDTQILSLKDRVVFVGTLITPREGADWLVKPQSLLVLDDSGRVLGRPNGGYRFHAPRSVVDQEGRLRLLWGESGGSGSQSFSNHTSVPVSAVLQSSYDPELGWRDARLVWGEADRDQMFAFPAPDSGTEGGDGTIGVRVSPTIEIDAGRLAIWFTNRSLVASSVGLVTAMEPRSGGTSLLREDPTGRWSAARRFEGADPELAAGAEGELWMAYRTSNPRQLRVAGSQDGGVSWERPAVVAQLRDASANHPRLLPGAEGQLHLLWSHGRRGELSSAVRHSVSQDRGRTWSPPSTFPYPGSFTDWDAAVDPCGGVHLVYANEGTVWHTRWSGGWTPATVIYAGQTPFNSPAIAWSERTGRLHLVGTVAMDTASDSGLRFGLIEMTMRVSSRGR